MWTDDDVVIGFRRLSIIDIDHSHQPLPWLDGRYHLIFNGEIYNYLELRERLAREFGATFDTDGDGEAIVAGYHYLGEKIVRELRGMFAFLIWDAQERVLFGARDWFGIKPLYTYADERGTFFASEKKSLLDVAEPDAGATSTTTALQHYLTLQYVPEPASMHETIRRIESGTYFTLRPGEHAAPAPLLPPGLRDQAGARRRTSCTARSPRRSRTRSRSTCAPTSRSARSCPAASTRPRSPRWPSGTTRTCSPSPPASSARATARSTWPPSRPRRSASSTSPRSSRAEEMMDTLPLIVWYLDDPVADPALGAAVLHRPRGPQARQGRAVRRGRRRAVRRLHDLPRADLAARVRPRARRSCGAGSAGCRRAIPEGMRGKDLLRRGSIGIEERYYGNARIFRPDEMSEVVRALRPGGVVHGRDPPALRSRPTHLDGSTRMQYVDLFTWLRGDILVKADKMTMANSLELRVPFLDTEVFGVGVVDPDRAEDHQGDDEVRAAPGARRDRAAARAEPGQARLPGADPALAQGRHVRLGARRSSPTSQADDLIDADAVLRLLDAHRAGPHDYSRKIWTLLVFLHLARHLRRGAHPPEHPRAGLPRAPLGRVPAPADHRAHDRDRSGRQRIDARWGRTSAAASSP